MNNEDGFIWSVSHLRFWWTIERVKYIMWLMVCYVYARVLYSHFIRVVCSVTLAVYHSILQSSSLTWMNGTRFRSHYVQGKLRFRSDTFHMQKINVDTLIAYVHCTTKYISSILHLAIIWTLPFQLLEMELITILMKQRISKAASIR